MKRIRDELRARRHPTEEVDAAGRHLQDEIAEFALRDLPRMTAIWTTTPDVESMWYLPTDEDVDFASQLPPYRLTLKEEMMRYFVHEFRKIWWEVGDMLRITPYALHSRDSRQILSLLRNRFEELRDALPPIVRRR